jgi:hypothetical protein
VVGFILGILLERQSLVISHVVLMKQHVRFITIHTHTMTTTLQSPTCLTSNTKRSIPHRCVESTPQELIVLTSNNKKSTTFEYGNNFIVASYLDADRHRMESIETILFAHWRVNLLAVPRLNNQNQTTFEIRYTFAIGFLWVKQV